MTWQPSLGAWPEGEGAHFRVWAPEAGRLAVVLEEEVRGRREYPLKKADDGYFSAVISGVGAGALYSYRVDGRGPFPDPASRRQPRGIHGPSAVVDPRRFRWSDANWTGLELKRTVFYELHVGTFTPQGSFEAAAQRLPYLKDLGITAVELMPVADFPGRRNWGYDGVALFAPANCYGSPDALRGFVDEAHALGLAVYLDVVYNHLGPDGAYLNAYSPLYFTEKHHTPWGAAINFDGPRCKPVRNFFVENALYWVHEYHIDGLRLDATHAILDDSPTHILTELADAVRRSAASWRKVQVIAEDSRNLAHMVKPVTENGWELDGVWSDDFHHQMRRSLAGDSDGYFADFSGSPKEVAATIRQGWFYCGQYAEYFQRERGTDPSGIPPERFVFFIQNHDQVGNRAFGDRLHHKVDLASYRAASTLLLCCPETPLLFMGQEWAASTPFQYFTDHHQELGRLVTQGRRSEFKRFAVFSQPESREKIPDPQDRETFERCRLNWQEIEREPHAALLKLYRALLRLRLAEPAFVSSEKPDVIAAGDGGVLLRHRSGAAQSATGGDILVIVWLRGSGSLDLTSQSVAQTGDGLRWEILLTTEDPEFTADSHSVSVNLATSGPFIRFGRPGAVVLRQAAIQA